MDEGKDTAHKDIDWEKRTLCSDESCIGVIGSDGLCKECGMIYSGKPSEEDPETEPDVEYEDAFETEFIAEAEDDSQTDVDWEHRTLCSDESCIGVIGPDGRCKECGQVFENH